MTIAFAAGGAVDQCLTLRAEVLISFLVIQEVALVEIPFAVGGATVAKHRLDLLILQPFADWRDVVARIQPNMGDLEAEARLLACQALQVRSRIMDIARRDMPKERELIDICREEKAAGRKVLVYSVYTGTRDTTSRLKVLLEQEGFKVAVLRASVDASRREDWIAEQLDRGIDVLITNPELVKTGLDLLEFPTIVFMQSGYNVYSLQQAARRSWRIGQKQPVRVIYLGYAATSQITCLGLMAKKITVSQSTSGDVPESGLDVLNQDGDSVEVALARQLVH
jgi:SNF2 family DNA or RNA helicase